MKPTYATQCLLRLDEWVYQIHYCIRVALLARRCPFQHLNAEWWLDRAKIHVATMRLMQHEYRASVSLQVSPSPAQPSPSLPPA